MFIFSLIYLNLSLTIQNIILIKLLNTKYNQVGSMSFRVDINMIHYQTISSSAKSLSKNMGCFIECFPKK
jgi:hypothetical protein